MKKLLTKKGIANNFQRSQAGDQGFEPRLTVPETAVLPLDEPPPGKEFYHFQELASIPTSREGKYRVAFPLVMVKFGDNFTHFG